ncbi:MAG: hypothetical protein QM808_14175 [Steroidobacteraceae bacterium]
MKAVSALTIALGSLLLGNAGAATPQADVTVQLVARRVETLANGKEQFKTAEQAHPGDLIEYQATYTNRGNAAARNMAATLPVPATGLEYLTDSAAPKAVLASVDGKTFSPMPLTRVIKQANGQSITQVIPTTEYRYLRWNVGELPAGSSITVSARMRVSTQPIMAIAAAR